MPRARSGARARSVRGVERTGVPVPGVEGGPSVRWVVMRVGSRLSSLVIGGSGRAACRDHAGVARTPPEDMTPPSSTCTVLRQWDRVTVLP
ncbi:hypothetical protein GCM10009602_31900 [Nocardiopsis tropica]